MSDSLYFPFEGDFEPVHEGVIAEFATSLLGPGFVDYKEIALFWDGSDHILVQADYDDEDERHWNDDGWDYDEAKRIPLAWQEVGISGFFQKDVSIYLEPVG